MLRSPVSSPAPVTPSPSTARFPWARRALDLFVIAWIVAVGLTSGRQLVDWWREDPTADPVPLTDTGEDWFRRAVRFEVGASGLACLREPFQGSRDDVDQRLMQLVQASMKDAPSPTADPGDAERELLAKLRDAPPIATDDGRGTLYRWAAPFPGMIGTRPDAPTGRILAHGFALPSGPKKWTLYVLPMGLEGRASAQELPSKAVPLLAWTDAAGRTVASFRGPGPVADWIRHWEARYGPPVLKQIDAKSATLRFESAQSVVELQIEAETAGSWLGVLWTIPRAHVSLPERSSLPTAESALPIKEHP